MAAFRILLALDEAENSEQAVDCVGTLVSCGLVCDVTLFHVPETSASLSQYGPFMESCEDEQFEKLLNEEGRQQVKRNLRSRRKRDS